MDPLPIIECFFAAFAFVQFVDIL
jgi:hypothetical protein